MDGFDDLLSAGRSALEDNPFADPFAKRSISPDPWTTPFADSSADHAFTHSTSSVLDPYADTYDAITPIDDTTTHETAYPADETDVHLPQTHQSLGFRESVESTLSQTATIRPTEKDEDTEPLGVAALESARSTSPLSIDTKPSPPSSPLSPPAHDAPRSSTTASHIVVSPSSSSSNSRTSNEFVSPLERAGQLGGIDHSISGLSLGAEPVSAGWQSDQNAWGGQVDDDSDDDKPIGRALKLSEGTESKSPPSLVRSDSNLPPVFVISVEDPQKVGDPIRSFTMYTVHTRTTSPLFQKSAFSVLRRYSDFLWLYETLSANNPGVVVPPVPEKNPFGRFDDQFVRQRRFALEKCIQKIANHPVLGQDSDLKLFLESDTFALDIKHRKAEIAHERGGVLASIGQAVAGPRFHETDEWFDRQKAYLDSLESQLRGLVKAIDLVARQRAEMATAAGEFSQATSELASSDVGKQVAHSLSGLAEVERRSQELQTSQSEQDMVTLMGTVDEYARLINSVRLAFNSRVRTYHTWRAAESDLLRTKQNHEKNRAQGRLPPDRLSYSLSQIAEAERRASEAKHEYEHVSKLVKSEVARFEEERIQDFKDSLHAFLEGMIAKQKELIGAWENYQQILLKRVGAGGGAPAAAS